MKRSLSFLAIGMALALTGCVHTRTVDLRDTGDPSYARINRLAQQKKATVTLADNQTVTVYRLQVAPDSTFWWQDGRWEAVPTAEIRAIQFEDRSRSALIGTVSGVAAGVLVSLALGTKEVKDECVSRTTECFFFCFSICKQWSYRRERNLSYEVGATLGAGIGFIVGRVTKARDVYRIEAPAPALPVVAEGVEQQILKKQ